MLAPGSYNEQQSSQSLTESIPARCCISCLHENAMSPKEPRTIACPGSTKQLLPVQMSENQRKVADPHSDSWVPSQFSWIPGGGSPKIKVKVFVMLMCSKCAQLPVLGQASGIRELRASLPVLRTRNITVPVFSSCPFFFPARDPRETQKDLIIQAQRSPRNQGFCQRLLVPN